MRASHRVSPRDAPGRQTPDRCLHNIASSYQAGKLTENGFERLCCSNEPGYVAAFVRMRPHSSVLACRPHVALSEVRRSDQGESLPNRNIQLPDAPPCADMNVD